MTIDLSEFAPVANDWLEINPSYEGKGKAVFTKPRGTIEAPGTVRLDDFGSLQIEMGLSNENINCRRKLVFGIQEFLSGEKPKKRAGRVTMGMGLNYANPCKSLRITTEHGTFRTHGKVLYWPRTLDPAGGAGKIVFHPIRSQFDTITAGRPKYWVIPLLNYLGDFHQSHPELDNHPLRLFKTPMVRAGLSQEEQIIARIKANERNKLIIFRFRDRWGFIEPLPDYESRKSRLLSGTVPRLVTSVMVGEVRNSSIEFESLDSWFPFEFLLLLGIATGSEIGAPWIEFRDAEGNLVRRAHVSLGAPVFLRGHASIPGFDDATGRLLTQAYQSPEWNSEMV